MNFGTSGYGFSRLGVKYSSNSAVDPYFANVVLLLGFEGADGSTVITDESPAAHGNATVQHFAHIDVSQKVFGGSSLLIGSALDSVWFADSNDWNLSNQPFTIECRYRPVSTSGTHFIVCQWEAAPNLGWAFFQSAAALSFSLSTTGSDNIAQMSGGSLIINTWYAICAEFDGSKYRLYLDGIMIASSTTLRTIFNSTLPLAIGSTSTSFGFSNIGWVDEGRITKAARYASDAGYPVSTTAFPRSG